MPQQRHVIDAVRTRDHPRDQPRDFQVGVAATGLVDPHVLGDQVLQASAGGELQDRPEARARHEVGVIELGGEVLAYSHLPDVLRLWWNWSLDKTNSPATERHFGFTTRASDHTNHGPTPPNGGSGLTPPRSVLSGASRDRSPSGWTYGRRKSTPTP